MIRCGKMLNTGTGSTTCRRVIGHHGLCTETDVDAPAPFEALRRYAADAVDQLVQDMAAQNVAYCVPETDALALLRAVAAVRHESPWATWESWALRHAIPVHEIARRLMPDDYVRTSTGGAGPSADERRVLQARLRDLLGYCILGLVLAESEPA